MENIEKRIGSVKKSGFLWGGMLLIIVLTIVSIYIYQSHVENGDGIYYTIFPDQMQNVYVSAFQLWPFIIFALASVVAFFFKVTTLDVDKVREDGKVKAVTGCILINVILFLVFWACCWLFDQMNFSEGMFSDAGYMNFLTVIVGAVMAVRNLIIFSVCKILGHEI